MEAKVWREGEGAGPHTSAGWPSAGAQPQTHPDPDPDPDPCLGLLHLDALAQKGVTDTVG